MTKKYICVHTHFYQPPRENPWLGVVERQESAYPYHDWNARITDECYLPNTHSPILDHKGEVIKHVNNYERLSFNFGPTLLSWMQKQKADVYSAIIESDKESQKRFSGHGAAIAQVYNHIIMPLANRRDKQTQVVWGIKDFICRFGREPEGIWLAETAVDVETLEVVAENGIKFTILAPRQAKEVRKIGDHNWQSTADEHVDITMPYLCQLPSGKTISIFFYDGNISQGIAFGNILNKGDEFANSLIHKFSDNSETPQLVSIATDGETFGHHRRYGNMALAYCFDYIEKNKLAKITVYGEYLEEHPPTHEVNIVEDSSWSCSHGIGRWKCDCGCNTEGNEGWDQQWRSSLRDAMDMLRDNVRGIYEKKIASYIKNPWQVRDDYINILLDNSHEVLKNFFDKHSTYKLSKKEMLSVLKLLEMQRYAMFMYTSCGWFFDDISRIESVQIMQCAARVIQLAAEVSDVSYEEDFVNILKQAKSNVSVFETGDKVYEMLVRPTIHENSNIKLLESFLE